MRVLYPSDPLDAKAPDGAFNDEYQALRAAGVAVDLLSSEEFDQRRVRVRPALQSGDRVLYRGWMLTPDQYATLAAGIVALGGTMVTMPEQYRRAHHLSGWYATCADLTPRTIFLARDADFAKAIAELNWSAYFVKDYVKSLTTKRGSVANSADEVSEVVSAIEGFRGEIEGGVCVREFEALTTGSEERYFALGQCAYGRGGSAPPLVHEVANRMNLPFISIDVAEREDGALRIIELGVAQVSDR